MISRPFAGSGEAALYESLTECGQAGEWIFRWFHETDRRLTGGQSRFIEAEPAKKTPPDCPY
jgi:hypothetical protein